MSYTSLALVRQMWTVVNYWASCLQARCSDVVFSSSSLFWFWLFLTYRIFAVQIGLFLNGQLVCQFITLVFKCLVFFFRCYPVRIHYFACVVTDGIAL